MGLVVKTFNNGDVIVKEGDMGRSLFRLVEGSADVITDHDTSDPFRLAVLNEGDYFGEMAIFEECPRSATVVARGTVRAIEIPEGELNEFMTENPDVIVELINHLGNKIQAMTNDFNEAEALLNNLREADAGKKQSLFSKIKKHMDLYQANKVEISEPKEDSIRQLYESIYRTGEHNVETYSGGSVIYKAGDPSDAIYILHDGNVNLFIGAGTDVLYTDLKSVSVFGETGLVNEEARELSAVTAFGDTLIETIRKEELEAVFATSPDKITLILRILSYRLRRLNIDFRARCKEITENYGN